MKYTRLTTMVLLVIVGIAGVIAYAGNSVQAASPAVRTATIGINTAPNPNFCRITSTMFWDKTRVGTLVHVWENHGGGDGSPRRGTASRVISPPSKGPMTNVAFIDVAKDGDVFHLHGIFYKNSKFKGKGTVALSATVTADIANCPI